MILADFRQALRAFRTHPTSSAAIVLTLALAIGANGTLFALINAVLFVPLPIRDQARLVSIYSSREDGTGNGGLSYPDFLDLKEGMTSIEDMLGFSGLMATFTGKGSSEVIFGEMVTANYFSVLGVRPQIGRGFEAGEETSAAPVVVIGDRLWRRRFDADLRVVGRPMSLNGRPYTIVGVAPADFPGLLFGAFTADIWVPVSMMGQLRTDQRTNRSERWMFVKGRLTGGASAAEAGAAARVVAQRLQRSFPESNAGRTFRVWSYDSVLVNPDADRAVIGATAGVMLAPVLVLAVACANLAGVMLARSLSRRKEFAVRLAIGARPRHIVRQLVIEASVLAVLGGFGGLFVAYWGGALLESWRPELPVPISLNARVDWRVVTFTFALTAIATVLFGVLPSLRSARTPAEGSKTVIGLRRRRFMGLREAVLVPQFAIAITLVASAGFLVRSLLNTAAVAPGFDADRTFFVSLNLAMSGYDDERARQFYSRLADALEQTGTVTGTAVTARLPLDLYGNQSASFSLTSEGPPTTVAQVSRVARGYFETMQIPLIRGRAFTAADEDEGASPVAIVSAAAARRYWVDAEPLGRRLYVQGSPPAIVIGVAADVKVLSLGESPTPFVYQPLKSGHGGLLRMVARASGHPAAALASVQRIIHELDPAVAVFEGKTMRGHLDTMLYPYRLVAAIGSVVAVLSLVLATIGLYGVLACGVTERLRELAIRAALGAGPRAMVVAAAREAGHAAFVGAIIGVAMTIAASRFLVWGLVGVSGSDLPVLASTAAILMLAIAVATVAPMRRAIRTPPSRLLNLP